MFHHPTTHPMLTYQPVILTIGLQRMITQTTIMDKMKLEKETKLLDPTMSFYLMAVLKLLPTPSTGMEVTLLTSPTLAKPSTQKLQNTNQLLPTHPLKRKLIFVNYYN